MEWSVVGSKKGVLPLAVEKRPKGNKVQPSASYMAGKGWQGAGWR